MFSLPDSGGGTLDGSEASGHKRGHGTGYHNQAAPAAIGGLKNLIFTVLRISQALYNVHKWQLNWLSQSGHPSRHWWPVKFIIFYACTLQRPRNQLLQSGRPGCHWWPEEFNIYCTYTIHTVKEAPEPVITIRLPRPPLVARKNVILTAHFQNIR